jgi:hypothetical protein
MEELISFYELQIKQLDNTVATLKENELLLSVLASLQQSQSVLPPSATTAPADPNEAEAAEYKLMMSSP